MPKKSTNVALAIIFIILVVYNPFASFAQKFNQESFMGSIAVYGVYRTIDRIVTLASDVDIQGGVLVASITASPGILLQPAVKALERFINILFPFMILSGMLSLIIVPLAKIGALIGFLGIILRVVKEHFFPKNKTYAVADRLSNALVKISVILALIVPISYSSGYIIGNWMTSTAWDEAYTRFSMFSAETGLDESSFDSYQGMGKAEIEDNEITIRQNNDSVLGGLSDWVQEKAGSIADKSSEIFESASGEALVMLNKATEISGTIWGIVESSTNLLIAYIVRTVLLPVLIGWALIWLMRQIFPRVTEHAVDLDVKTSLLPKSDEAVL